MFQMPDSIRILVVDDERSVREMISILLAREGYEIVTAPNGDKAGALLEAGEHFDLVITDLAMDKGNGLQVLSAAIDRDPHCPVILITAFGTTESAVEAMKKGAHDYIEKPFNVDKFKLIVRNALDHRTLIRENIDLRARVRGEFYFADIIGRSEPMRKVIALCKKVSDSAATVHISGESGTGKEVVARAIHFDGPRTSEAFVAINCGALPEQLMESELFGHVRGAFTGATEDKPGLFEAAHGGTLFLDEIGELPLPLQVKLLRVLQEKKIRPVGGANEIPVDVRIISATNSDLQELVTQNRFRADLFYRLNVIQITMPPLRDRMEDIPLLVKIFLSQLQEQIGSRAKGIGNTAMRALMAYRYPGNVRELKNILERSATLASGEQVELDDLPPGILTDNRAPIKNGTALPDSGVDLDATLASLERKLIEQALDRSEGAQKPAAELLGITVRSLRYRIDKPENGSHDE